MYTHTHTHTERDTETEKLSFFEQKFRESENFEQHKTVQNMHKYEIIYESGAPH